jgi:hypothetical protein
MQGLVEKVLEADGITKEMIQAQQDKLEFLQKLSSTANEEARLEMLKENENLVDADLFNLLTRLLQTAAATGDQESMNQLEEIQSLLIVNTEIGRQIQQQTDEVQAAVESLQEAGQELTREKLVDLVIEAPNEIRLSALVSLARPGMDYQFFQILSQRIDAAGGEEQERLSNLREEILTLTEQIDEQVKQRSDAAQQLLDQILEAEDVTQAIQQNASAIDEFFVQAVQQSLDQARQSGDLERSAKLSQLEEVIRQATAQPPEIEFLEELLEAEDEAARQELLDSNKDKVTPELFQMISGLMNQVTETNQDPVLVDKIKAINRQVLRYSMQSSLQGE